MSLQDVGFNKKIIPTLEVRPEPSLAHLGKVSGNDLRLDQVEKCK